MIKLVKKSWLLPIILLMLFMSSTNAENSTLMYTETSAPTTISSSNSTSTTFTAITSAQNETTTTTTTTATEEMNCSKNIPSIENGNVTISNSSASELEATVICDKGYESNAATIVCNNNTWPTAVCSPKDCGNVTDDVRDAKLTLTNQSTKYPSLAVYECKEGYKSYGNNSIQCQSDGNWSNTTFNCTQIAEYNGTCYDIQFEDGGNACKTKNAICKNLEVDERRCLCKNDDVYIQSQETCFEKINVNSSLLNMKVVEPVQTDSVTLQWHIHEFLKNNFSTIIIDVIQSGEECRCGKNFTLPSDGNFTKTIPELTPGTNYTFRYYMKTKIGVPSNSDEVSSFTKPLPLGQTLEVLSITENSFTVSWKDNAAINYTEYSIEIYPSPRNLSANCSGSFEMIENSCTIPRYNSTTVVFKGLRSGENYTVKVYTSSNGTLSDKPSEVTRFTRPTGIAHAVITNITNSSLTVNWSGNSQDYDYYTIVVEDSESAKGCNYTKNHTIPNNRTSHVILGLCPAVEYFIKIYTVVDTIETDVPFSLSSFTRPSLPTFKGSVTNVTMEIFIIRWSDDKTITYTNWSIIFSSDLSDNVPDGICNSYHDRNCTFARGMEGNNTLILTGLDAGTEYKMWIFTINAGLHSENNYSISTFTVPMLPDNIDVPLGEITNNSFVIKYDDNDTKFTNWSIEVCNASGQLIVSTTQNDTNSYTVKNLTSGSKYFATVYTTVPGFNSSKNTTTVFTRPSDPRSVVIAKELVHANNFSVTYDVWDEYYDSINLTVCNETCIINMTVPKENNKTLHVANLTIATYYTVTLYTKLNETAPYDFVSQNPATTFSFTAPEQPNATASDVQFDFVQIRLDGNRDKLFDEYVIVYNSTVKTTVPRDQKNITIHNLTAGTYYMFEVYTKLTDINSDNFAGITTYTRPGMIEDFFVSNVTVNSIEVRWQSPKKGSVETYVTEFNCTSPNIHSEMNRTQIYNNSSLAVTAVDLDPGTSCSVEVITHIGNQTGEPYNVRLNETTKEIAPGSVTLKSNSTNQTSLFVAWETPDQPNGVIRLYQVLVVDNFPEENCLKAECTSSYDTSLDDYQCQEVDFQMPSPCLGNVKECEHLSLNYTANRLHPYRNYTVYIRAFTKCWGETFSHQLQTETDIPSFAPSIRYLNTSENSLNVHWNPLNIEDSNGIVTEYTIRYTTINKTCFDSNDGENVTKNITNINANLNSVEIDSLESYWEYDVEISASTSAGRGPFNSSKVRTSEAIPGDIDSESVESPVKDYHSINLTWNRPCRPNGVISGYIVRVHNTDIQEIKNYTSTDNKTEYTVTGLLPYRNYTIKIAAMNIKGNGNLTDGFIVRTNMSKPFKPNDPEVPNKSSNSLTVTWKALPQLNFTGPTHYRVTATDVKDETFIRVCNTTGFNSTTCILNNLDAFWNYTLYVTATTEAGSVESNVIIGNTSEDTPGNVSIILLQPEANVTKARSIIVSWEPPAERDLNGIISGYNITCTNTDSGNESYFNSTGGNGRTVTFTNISTGNYKVTVNAGTSVGSGSFSFNYTHVKAGAPLKPVEENNNLLMKKGLKKVSDDETQISVLLPLKDLLCNPSNGKPSRWGVVVVQDGKEDNEPFFGTKEEFESKRFPTYKKWSQVKDDDTIPAYVATPETWKPECGTLNKDFIVGDGDCSGVNGYCNGELQPGKSYRVRSFVCTDGGCTETMYSSPISTKPDPTIPIVAGVVAALVVITMAAVVVFLLKRRQVACFSKDVENKPSHRPGNEITLDNIETKQKNAFRPGPIKLTDFPGEVEKMHRDSDLIFADAYKLLKDKSPNHPLTAAEQQCSRPKNRYTNILPFDHSRVKLRPSDDIEGSDYINANYIPGYSSRREYIATQGPMIATFDDFWRMVWEQNVDTIVMLTKLMEKGRRKCDKYWPDIGEPVFYGDLVVSLQSESNLSDYTIKIFEVKMKEERKVITHFSYLKWPDMGCPETPELLLDFVKAVRQYTNRDKKPSPGPIVVHCSAGVGRTGTFIAVDYLLQHIRDHDDVDIYNLVLEMRNHRLNMVQTEDQYVYIHECLKAFITTDEEEEEEDEEPLYMNTEKEDEHIYVNTAFTKD